jgi:hypothetical protein
MRASEILRKLADVIDAKEGHQEQPAPTEITNRPEIIDVEVSEPTDTQGIEGQAQVNTRAMVPPLQQKLDLMKKLAGVEVPETDIAISGEEDCCPECGCEPCECEAEQDELSIMRQNAGIKPVVMAIADDDEPFEG